MMHAKVSAMTRFALSVASAGKAAHPASAMKRAMLSVRPCDSDADMEPSFRTGRSGSSVQCSAVTFGERYFELGGPDRFDEMQVEAGLFGLAFVRILPPARDGDDLERALGLDRTELPGDFVAIHARKPDI